MISFLASCVPYLQHDYFTINSNFLIAKVSSNRGFKILCKSTMLKHLNQWCLSNSRISNGNDFDEAFLLSSFDLWRLGNEYVAVYGAIWFFVLHLYFLLMWYFFTNGQSCWVYNILFINLSTIFGYLEFWPKILAIIFKSICVQQFTKWILQI